MTRIRLLPLGFIRIPGRILRGLGFKGWVTVYSKAGSIIVSEWPEPLAKALTVPWLPNLSLLHLHKCMTFLQTATTSVMIVDPHFLQPEYSTNAACLLSFIPQGIPTDIVACRGGSFPEEFASPPPGMKAWKILSSGDKSPFLHDRFVIVDGLRGLHFGNALAYEGAGMVLITDINQQDCQTISGEISDFLAGRHSRMDLVKIQQL